MENNQELIQRIKGSGLFNTKNDFVKFQLMIWDDLEDFIKNHQKYNEYKEERVNKKYFYYYKLPLVDIKKLGFYNKKQYLDFCEKYYVEIHRIHDKETLFKTINDLQLENPLYFIN